MLPPARTRPIRKFLGHGWDPNLHPRGFHGHWTFGHGEHSGGGHELPKFRGDATSKFETHVHTNLNARGHEIMRGHGSTHHEIIAEHIKSGVHARYYEAELRGKRRQTNPEALFTSGGAASGKSWISKTRGPRSAAIIDPDRAKNGHGVAGYDGLPTYHRLSSSGNSEVAASAVHEESSIMAKRLTQAAIAKRANIIVDSVGNTPATDGKPSSFEKKVRQALEAGYDVRVEHMHVDLNTARKQEATRATESGRKVDPEALTEGHLHSARNMLDIAKIEGPDGKRVHIVIWGAQWPDQPVKIAEGYSSSRGIDGLQVYNDKLFEEFKRKTHGQA